jgi:ankyrin repeat protein
MKLLFISLLLIWQYPYNMMAQNVIFLPNYHHDIPIGGAESNNRKLLRTAIESKDIQLVDSLLQSKKVSINEPNVFGETILGEVLSSSDDTLLISYLLSKNACLDCGMYISFYSSKEGIECYYKNPIRNAVHNSNNQIFSFIVKDCKSRGYERTLYDKEIFENAVIGLNYQAMLELVNYYDFSNLNKKSDSGQTMLTQAIESLTMRLTLASYEEANNDTLKNLLRNGFKVIDFLLNKGADIKLPNSKGETPLLLAKENKLLYQYLISRQ